MEASVARAYEPEQPAYHSSSLSWADDGYGAPERIVVVVADTFIGLRQAIRDRRWRREIHSPYDCTGIMFQQTCTILRVEKTAHGHQAVLLVTSYFDI